MDADPNPQQPVSPSPQPGGAPSKPSEKKLVAGILAILLGCLGIHKFYLGYQKEGLIMLLLTVLTCGVVGIVMSVIGIVEGVIYLMKPDAEFDATYVVGRKGWF